MPATLDPRDRTTVVDARRIVDGDEWGADLG